MKKFFLYFSGIIVFLGLLSLGGYSLYKSSFFNLKNIRYEYAQNNLPKVYIDTLKPSIETSVQSYIGQSLWKIDIFRIEKFIKSKPWIESVSISRVFPNEIVIQIEPKKIIANILKNPSQLQPVAEDSTVMDVVEISKSPNVPILSHVQFYYDKTLREAALEFLKELPADGSLSSKNISEILPFKVGAKSNPSFRVHLKNSKAEVLIDNQNVPIKAQRVSRVIDYLGDKELEDRIIDANFNKKVLVRPRNPR